MARFLGPEEIISATLEQRRILYRNGITRIDNAEAVRVVELIVSSGLPFRTEGQMDHGDRDWRAIEAIVNDRWNDAPLLEAAAKGVPPLSAIEPQIVEQLGEDYRNDNGGPTAAGYLIAKRLFALGFEKSSSQKMPPGSVAKTAATFRKKRA